MTWDWQPLAPGGLLLGAGPSSVYVSSQRLEPAAGQTEHSLRTAARGALPELVGSVRSSEESLR